jgi:hypothetical protein
MYKDVERYVRTYPQYQLNKQPIAKPAGVAHVLPIPEKPWESIAIDFAGPITTSQGFKYIMVIVDRFSGFLLCFPLAEIWTSLQKTLGINLIMATAFHQETNGQLERTNKTIMQTLRIFSNGNREEASTKGIYINPRSSTSLTLPGNGYLS